MKHKITAILYFLFAFTYCKSQATSVAKNNALSFELGKSGLMYNLNFDHKFQGNNFGLRAGLGANFSKSLPAFTAGGGGYYLVGRITNFFEVGLDLAYLSVKETSDDQKGVPLLYPDYPIETAYASINIGYRRYGQKTLFRAGISPGFIKDDFLPGAYISYGVIF